MIITVFGANGKVGRLVVAVALDRGHTVRAFCHKTSRLPEHPNLIICHGDIYNKESVAQALNGADAVVSALGSWATKRKNILTSGMQAIIPAMESRGINRIVSLTGADARAAGDQVSLIHRLTHSMLQRLAGKVLMDGEKHISLLATSQLNWSVLRSPPMLAIGNQKHYRLSDKRPLPWQTIPRTAVADALLLLAEKPRHARKAIYICRGKQ